MKRFISMVLCLVMVCTAFSSCTTLEEDDKGAIIDVYLNDELYNFDPSLALNDDNMVRICSLIFEGLTRLDDNGNWEKAMMDSYKYTVDEEEGVYKLVCEIAESKWSDGRTVQASDFVYAWKRIMDPEFKGDAAALLFDIKNARTAKAGDCSIDDFGVTSIDTYTLQILFEHDIDVDEFFKTVASVALVPLREDVVGSNSDNWAKKTTTIVCNGPFALKEIEYGKLLRVERNAYYRRDVEENEALDSYVIPWRIVTHYSYGDIEEQYELYNAGSLFYLGTIPLAHRAEEKSNATINDVPATSSLYFNTTNDLFKNAKVRQALSMALDRNEIINLITFGKAATGLIPYGVDDNGDDFRENADKNGTLINTSADVDGAKALLKEAKVTSGSFSISVKANSEQDLAVAQYVAGVWNDLGFNVKLNKIDASKSKTVENAMEDNFNTAYKNGDFDVILVDMNMLALNSAYGNLCQFAVDFSGAGVNMRSENYDKYTHVTGYDNEEYNELIEKIYASTDKNEKSTLLHDAEKMLMEDMPVAPLYFVQNAYLVNTKVLSGIDDTILGTQDFTRMKMKNYMAYKEAILAQEEEEADVDIED